jgi:hypothetical protein
MCAQNVKLYSFLCQNIVSKSLHQMLDFQTEINFAYFKDAYVL